MSRHGRREDKAVTEEWEAGKKKQPRDREVSGREWKAGDVALVTCVPFQGPERTERAWVGSDLCWHFTDGAGVHTSREELVTEARPLAVIDPDDREQIERLWIVLRDGRALQSRDNLQAALREFADPPSPRPDEPQGLGAVVEDRAGKVWFRMSLENLTWPGEVWQEQYSDDDRWSTWADIDVARVLSPGYDPEATT